MTWLGKLIGFIVGAIAFGPIGALLGLFFGHLVDRARFGPKFDPRSSSEAQSVFFESTFLIMGHITKADGRVSEQEIQAARMSMKKMGLSDSQKHQAIEFFNEGKKPYFNINATLEKLAKACRRHRTLLRMFLEIQLQAAYAGGLASPEQQHILQTICAQLRMPKLNFKFLNMIYGRAYYKQGHTGSQHGFGQTHQPLDECYAILEVNRKATDAEVKRAYRKLMSQNHPDKLVSKGLPEEMVKIATEKTQQIQKAYDTIRKARGIK